MCIRDRSTTDIECYGVYALNLNTGKNTKILARITVMASGGVGQVYRSTTNPHIATGDGIAMPVSYTHLDVYKRQVPLMNEEKYRKIAVYCTID